MWMNGPWMNGSWDWFPWMMIFALVFLTFLIAMLVFVFRGGGPMSGGHGTHLKEDSAREILDRRYARGEVNQEEYQRMRKELQ